MRDLLIRLTLRDLFRARWSERILEEMQRAILKNRPDLAQQIPRTRELMNSHVRDAIVVGYEPLCEAITLPDPNDRHVVAAAIHCHASVIVTLNLKDFPKAALAPFGIEAQHPDDFIEHLFDLHQSVVLEVVREQRASLNNPPNTIEELLSTFQRQGLNKSVDRMLPFANLL